MARVAILIPLMFYASAVLAFAGRDTSPPSWDVYTEKLILAFDIGIVAWLTVKNPVGTWMAGWSLTINYLGNVMLRIVSRMTPEKAISTFRNDIVALIALPLPML